MIIMHCQLDAYTTCEISSCHYLMLTVIASESRKDGGLNVEAHVDFLREQVVERRRAVLLDGVLVASLHALRNLAQTAAELVHYPVWSFLRKPAVSVVQQRFLHSGAVNTQPRLFARLV